VGGGRGLAEGLQGRVEGGGRAGAAPEGGVAILADRSLALGGPTFVGGLTWGLVGGGGGLVLHEAVNLEPVGPPSVPGSGLGHANHEALPQPAGLARRPVLLVNHAPVAVLALLDHRLVVARPPKEALAAFAGERAEVEAGGRLVAHAAHLVQHGVHLLQLLWFEGVEGLRKASNHLPLLHNHQQRSMDEQTNSWASG